MTKVIAMTSDWQQDSWRRAEQAREARVKADRANIRLWMTPEREDFLRGQLAGYRVTEVSVDGLRCADLLERLFCGLHHFPGHGEKIRKTDWNSHFVAGRGMSRVEMHLHPRVRGGDGLGLGRSHPDLDEMLANFRKYNPDVEK